MKLIKNLIVASAVTGILASSALANADLVAKGEKIFNSKNLGNCLACHNINGKSLDGPGSMGPKLQYLSAWPEEELYKKIYDPYTTNPASQMPAFGKSGWLSDGEIKALVAYLKTIN